MTNAELEETIRRDFDTLARKLGADILEGLARSYPERFSLWLSDLKFKQAPRFIMSFEAQLQPIDEAKADLDLAADTISEESNDVNSDR